jgi:hypothetical protein
MGGPYSFPDYFILVIGYIHISFPLPQRQTEEIVKVIGKSPPCYPNYSHVCKRVNKLYPVA